jgi:hypothetical protein
MTKREILELLNREVGLFHDIDEEFNLDFKTSEQVLEDLAELRDSVAKLKDDLREAVHGDKRFTVLKDTNLEIKDKVINIEGGLLIIDGQNVLMNNYITTQNGPVDSKPTH